MRVTGLQRKTEKCLTDSDWRALSAAVRAVVHPNINRCWVVKKVQLDG